MTKANNTSRRKSKHRNAEAPTGLRGRVALSAQKAAMAERMEMGGVPTGEEQQAQIKKCTGPMQDL